MDDELKAAKLSSARSCGTLQYVASDERTIAHVGFLEDVPWANTYKLRDKPIEQVAIVACLVRLHIGKEPQLYETLISHIV